MKKFYLVMFLCILLVVSGCSKKENISEKGIFISGITSGIGSVGQNTNGVKEVKIVEERTIQNSF